MLFNSLSFYIFFPVVTTLYFLFPFAWRWALLLAASCYFYMSFVPVYILILALTIVVDYWAAIWIERSEGPRRTQILWGSILVTCLILFVFKYFNFFNANLAGLAKFLGWNYSLDILSLVLPIGLSFHTFQSLSYVIEVYWGKFKAERHFGIYALYVMFYPQLVAGPIERPQNLLPQFHIDHKFEYERVTDGLKRMAWGLFKKVVIADRLKVYVDLVYGNPAQYDGINFIVATVFFAFQIFCDFSGYSDIAIGSAQVMGFKLMENFKQPYASRSVSEFWQRWHISLMSWFRDYVYIPLGGNRVPVARWYWNIMVVFLISGLWHGANWTYVIWGLLNGIYVVAGAATKSLRESIVNKLGLARIPVVHHVIQVVMTFSLICLAWIFFRAQTVSDAFYMITHLFSVRGEMVTAETSVVKQAIEMIKPVFLVFHKKEFLLMVMLIVGLETVHYVQQHMNIRRFLSSKPFWVRWMVYYAGLIGILVLGVFHNENQFIYFQF
jgi:alginate O-acetyltransferase complex protein AlgI